VGPCSLTKASFDVGANGAPDATSSANGSLFQCSGCAHARPMMAEDASRPAVANPSPTIARRLGRGLGKRNSGSDERVTLKPTISVRIEYLFCRFRLDEIIEGSRQISSECGGAKSQSVGNDRNGTERHRCGGKYRRKQNAEGRVKDARRNRNSGGVIGKSEE